MLVRTFDEVHYDEETGEPVHSEGTPWLFGIPPESGITDYPLAYEYETERSTAHSMFLEMDTAGYYIADTVVPDFAVHGDAWKPISIADFTE